jgi:hypothetical protein
VKGFNLKKLNKVEGNEQYRVEISNRFSALKNWDSEVDINRAWETIREYIKISAEESLGYYELEHKPWFDERWIQDVHLVPGTLGGDSAYAS